MNRYRLSQILEILLFSVTDPQIGKNDPLLMYYRAYYEFHKANSSERSGRARKDRTRQEYQKCQKQMIAYLADHCNGKMKSEDDILMLCSLYYRLEEIEGEIIEIERLRVASQCANIDEENICRYYLKKISDMTASLITYRDGMAAIRYWSNLDNGVLDECDKEDIFRSSSVYNKVEIWNLVCRITVPDLYIVMAAVDNGLGMEALYEQRPYIMLSDKLLDKIMRKGLAENHMHFNVGMDYEAVWLYYMDLGFLEERYGRGNKDENIRLELALFRAVAACYLEDGDYGNGFDEWIGHGAPDGTREIIYAMAWGIELQELKDELVWKIVWMYRSITSNEAVREGDYLLDKVFAQYLEYKVSSEFVLLYRCYHYIVHHEADTFFTRVFLQYIRYKNQFFRKRQEGNVLQGLKYFKKKYNLMRSSAQTVMQKSEAMFEVFRCQAKMGCLRKLEIRVAPDVRQGELEGLRGSSAHNMILSALYDQIYQILYAYRRYILECLVGVRETWRLLKKEENRKSIKEDIDWILRESENIHKISIPTLGIIFHFLKFEPWEDVSDLYCWQDVKEYGEEKMPERMKRRYFVTEIAVALEKIRSTIPKMDEYLVGVDAASEENTMEPWVFAQAYREMRSRRYTKPVLQEKSSAESFHRIQNVGFTYHVGEEFRHIVSGFRHIDEVLEGFRYKAGDRLGHALALGINVEQWVCDNEVVPIPRLEYLENLLWMWGVNTFGGVTLPIRLEILENKIMDVVARICSDTGFKSDTITVKMLYQAYQKKLLSDHLEILRKICKKNEEEYKVCLTEKYGRNCLKDCKVYKQYKKKPRELDGIDMLLMANYCPLLIREFEKVIMISVTREEIGLYLKLQEYLVHKVEKKGIYLELNPTSNLAIGDFSQLGSHPIFRLSDLDECNKNHVMVTVNSDDPAVFNTNVENELAYIYYAANEFGYSKDVVLEWIEHIRQRGMEASFVRQEKETAQILIEIQDMMERIKRLNM